MKHILLLPLLFLISVVFGQHVKQTERIELPYKYSDENYIMALAGEKGIVLFRESEENVPKKDLWEVKVIDTSLKEKLDFNIEVEYKYQIMGYEYRDGYLYFLFDDTNTSKTDFLLIKSSIYTGELEYHNIANELVMDLSHLLVNAHSVVLGGYINNRPTFMIFDYINDKVQVVPGFFNTRSEILDFAYNADHDVYNVLMEQKNTINHNEIAIKSFDKNGKLLFDDKYEFDDNRKALNGKVIISEDNQIIISGSYAGNNSYYSQGIYFSRLEAGEEMKLSYTAFSEIEHFFDYMSPKRSAKMKKRVIEARKNNTTFEYKSQVYVHDLAEIDGEFIVISELYKPEYKETTSSMAMGYSMTDDSYRGKTGQKYVHRSSKLAHVDGASRISYYESIIAGFDQNGKLLWDRCMPLEDAETLTLEQVAENNKQGNLVTMMYKDKNNISYKTFSLIPDETLADSTLVIDTFKEQSQVDSTSDLQGKIQHWYDDNFIVWGYQKVKKETQSDKKQNIFFINKLLIE